MPYSVKTSVLKSDPQTPSPDVIAQAAQVIQRGGLVAFPTETVYGLGADALNKQAVQRIFEAKERPDNDPLIVHIATIEQLHRIAVEIPEIAYNLISVFWPGALTLILRKHPDVPQNVTANQNTIAARMPDHPVALALIQAAAVPIAAPSANRFARPSPTCAAHVLADLNNRVDIVLDAGATTVGIESTILDLTSPAPTILRPGGISLESLCEVIPSIAFRPQYLSETSHPAPAPGALLKHYSPNASLIVFDGENERVYKEMRRTAQAMIAENKSVGIMAMDSEAWHFQELTAAIVLLGTDMPSVANHLFAAMRELENRGVDVILVRVPNRSGLGLAIWDRLLRAAAGHIITLNDTTDDPTIQ